MKLNKDIVNYSYLDNSDLGKFLQTNQLTETEKTYEPIEYCCLWASTWNLETDTLKNSEVIALHKWKKTRQNKSKWLLALLLLFRFPKLPIFKTPKTISKNDFVKEAKHLNPEVFVQKNIHLNDQSQRNDIFYANRRNTLQLQENSKKHYAVHSIAIISLLALASIVSQNFIPTMSVAKNLRTLENLQNKITVSQQNNDVLQQEIERLKKETEERQSEITNKGTTLLNEIASGSKTIEEALQTLQATIDAQNNRANSHAPILNVTPETTKKLLEKMEEKKTKLLDTYTKEVSEELTKQNQDMQIKFNNILTDTNGVFSKLPENAKTAVTQALGELTQEISKDADEFSKKLAQDIDKYKKELNIAIDDAKTSGITVEVLQEVLDLADKDLNEYIQIQTIKNSQELLNKIKDRQGKIVKKVLESATQQNKNEIFNKINNESISDQSKVRLKAIISSFYDGTGLTIKELPAISLEPGNTETPPTKPEERQQNPADDEIKKLQKEKDEKDKWYRGGMYGWCNNTHGGGGPAWLRHIYTLGACSTYSIGHNINGKIKGYGIDWDGIFNIVNAISVVFDVVTVASGVGAVVAVAKTALKTGVKYAMKTVTKIVAKQVVKTASMAGAGASIGEATGIGLEAGALMGATMSLGSFSKANIVARAAANVAARNAMKGATLVQKAIQVAKATKTVAVNTVKGVGISVTKTAVGAGIGAGIAKAGNEDMLKGAMVGAALTGPITAGAKTGFNRLSQTTQAQQIIAKAGARVFNNAQNVATHIMTPNNTYSSAAGLKS